MAQQSDEAPESVDTASVDIRSVSWAEPFFRFMSFVDDAGRLVSLHHQGMHQIIVRQKTLEILGEALEPVSDNADKAQENLARIRRMQEQVDGAQAELDSEHSTLQAHLLVGIWGAFESYIEDFCAEWLLAHQGLLKEPAFERVKISLAAYHSFETDADRMRHVVREVQRNLGSDLKRGIGQFESVLDSIGMAGKVADTMRDGIYVFQQVRNVVAHRGGVADARLVTACPNQEFTVGQKVDVSRERFSQWLDALASYGLLILIRAMSPKRRRVLAQTGAVDKMAPSVSAFLRETFPELAEGGGQPELAEGGGQVG